MCSLLIMKIIYADRGPLFLEVRANVSIVHRRITSVLYYFNTRDKVFNDFLSILQGFPLTLIL